MKRNKNNNPYYYDQQYYPAVNGMPVGVAAPQYIPNTNPKGAYIYPQKKKKSGAKFVVGTTKEGRQFRGVSAWFHRKDCGLVKINAFENSNTPDEVTSNLGNVFLHLMFEVFYQNSGQKALELGLFNLTTGKVLLKRLGIVISTKAPNGGYAGFFSKKNK